MSDRGFFKDILSVSGTNAFNTIIRFLSGVILARILGPEDKGLYATIIVIPMMIITISELGIRRAAIQHIGEKKYPMERIIASLSLFFILTSLVGVAICGYIYVSQDDPRITSYLIILALITIPINLLNKFNNGVLVGQQRYKVSNYLRSVPVIMNFVFLILFIGLLKLSVAGALLSIIVANIATGISGLRIISRQFRISLRYDKEMIKSLLSMGFIYAIALFLARLNFKIDILLLAKWSDMAQVGYYSLGASFAEGWQAPFAVGGVILSASANSIDQGKVNSDMARLFRFTLLISVIISIIIYFIAPYIIPLIYSDKFIPSIPVIQTILPAIVIVITAKMLASRISGLRKTYLVIFIYVPSLLLNVIFNYLFIPTYGAMGAVYATIISYAFSFILLIGVYSHITKTPVYQLFAFRSDDFRFIGNFKRFKEK